MSDESDVGPSAPAEATATDAATDAATSAATDAETDVATEDHADAIADAQAAIEEARRRVAEVPAEVVVTNHVMGLYELAAIHLSADQPDLRSAGLAIDAVAALVDGLGDRLGPETSTMRDALANIRLAYVQVKNRTKSASANA